MPIILITGAPGWIGTRLVQALQEDLPGLPSTANWGNQYQLCCLVLPGVNAAALEKSGRVKIIRGDLRNPADVKTFCQGAEGGMLVHCAGIVHPRLFVRECKEVNVDGTRNLLQAAENAGVRRVVVLSSNSPMGSNPRRDHLFDENSPYHPYMSYGRSKMLMEQVVHEIHARGRLETVILRPTWFYGPCQPERQTTFFRMIKNGGAPIAGDGGNLRSMVYIDNLCQAILLSLQMPQANGQTYWIADSRPYAMTEITDTIERLMETEFGIPVTHRRLRLPSVACDAAQLLMGSSRAWVSTSKRSMFFLK